MKHHKNSRRKSRSSMKEILQSHRDRYDLEYREALSLAKKLMNIPDLESNKYTDKQIGIVERNIRIAERVAEYVTRSPDATILYTNKAFFDSINQQIEAANEYHGLMLLGMPKMSKIDVDKLENLPNFYYLVPSVWNKSNVCKHTELNLPIHLRPEVVNTKAKYNGRRSLVRPDVSPKKVKPSKKEKKAWRTRDMSGDIL